MDLRELGEFGLIEALRRRAGSPGRRWRRAIGDDAAVLRPRAEHELVLTVDALVEGVHFRWSATDARSLGHKALCVNLSDLGAMGARPLGFLLSVGLPPDARPGCLDGFFRGLLGEARKASCPLVGGDTVAAPQWNLSITAVGEVRRGRLLCRSGGRVGDRLMVTGELGSAGLGLRILEAGGPRDAAERRFAREHIRPRVPYTLGFELARRGWATAAIDLSDGLGRDLVHLASHSGVGAEVRVDRLPLARGFSRVCGARGLDPLELALGGGEDYQLLFAAASSAPDDRELSRRLGWRVRQIGHLRRGKGVTWLDAEGRVDPGRMLGWEHFKPA